MPRLQPAQHDSDIVRFHKKQWHALQIGLLLIIALLTAIAGLLWGFEALVSGLHE